MKNVLLVGNNVAMLVAAIELTRRGQGVTLITDARPVGAHFAGMKIGNDVFDIGMVMLEQYHHSTPCDNLDSYDPRVRNDWTRFGHIAGRWMNANAEMVRVPTPQTLVGGKIWPDYLIANRLEAFFGFDGDLAAGRSSDAEKHPRYKTKPGVYDTLSYAQCAEVNHGQLLHSKFIEPFVHKLLVDTSSEFLGRYHRAAWVPLFYPETLAAARQGGAYDLAEYPFWTTRLGSVGAWVQNMRNSLAAHAGVQMVDSSLTSLRIELGSVSATTQDGATYTGERVALGIPSERCHSLFGLAPAVPDRTASVNVLFCMVRADAAQQRVGCMMVVDDDWVSYRICDQDVMASAEVPWHRVTIEASPELLSKRYPELSSQDALKREVMGILQVQNEDDVLPLRCVNARNALALPTQLGVRSAAQAHDQLEALMPNVALTGNLLGFGVASFNDQVVQGLKIVEECI